jgi:hypothetical protein
VTTCRSCGAPIEWRRTVNGKAMPIDAVPTPSGNLVIDGHKVRAATEDEKVVPHLLYTSHFATCPDARQHRKAP